MTESETAERDSLDIDVLFVGAGPASLAGALHLARLVAEHNRSGETPLEASIAILEKGKEVGSHALSGAVLDPRALQELFPTSWQDAPLDAEVTREQLLYLTSRRALRLPVPPPLDNRGKYVVSLGRLLKWMAPQVEAAGVDIFCEFPGQELLIEEDRVVGVRTADRGVDRTGRPKANFEPGIDIRTRAVVLGEGVRGSLAKDLERRFGLAEGRNPQVYALGLKELWEVPAGRIEPGEVLHTMGWPLDRHTFGGGFLYGVSEREVSLGLVVGLDYHDPRFDPHRELQRFKTHPRLRSLLEGGTMRFYGAKAIPEGGWWSMPRPYCPGALVIGDSGSFLNSLRLKGIHLAMKSGQLAAETVFDSLLRDDFSQESLSQFERRVQESWAGTELHRVRNFHQAFDHGRLAGMVQAGLGMMTGGRGWGLFDRLRTEPGHERMESLEEGGQHEAEGGALEPDSFEPDAFEPDGELTFDRLTDLYNSATSHEEDQPSHLLVHDPEICVTDCAVTYGNPCERFCPAAVYEIVSDSDSPHGKRLQINASNCVHCKTCDIMDPYQIIDWVPPEGGGGPNYGRM